MPIETNDLNKALNSWPEGTLGFSEESELITTLHQLCKNNGYGRVHQLMNDIEDIWRNPEKMIDYQQRRERRISSLIEARNAQE